MCAGALDYMYIYNFNPYPAGIESDQLLPPVKSQVSLHQAVYSWLTSFKFPTWYPQKW